MTMDITGQKVTDEALQSATDAIDWYDTNIPYRRRWALSLRVLMIFLAGMAALVPVLTEVSALTFLGIESIWSSVFAGLAALVLAFEKFYGHSNAWMRFTKARQLMVMEKLDFESHWNIWLSQNGFDKAEMEPVTEWLECVRDFNAKIADIQMKETEQWIAEFSSLLKKTERNT